MQSGDELVDILKKGQGVLNILPLATVKEEVDSAIIELHPDNVDTGDVTQVATGS